MYKTGESVMSFLLWLCCVCKILGNTFVNGVGRQSDEAFYLSDELINCFSFLIPFPVSSDAWSWKVLALF